MTGADICGSRGVIRRLNAVGAADVTSFAAKWPSDTFVELAARIGPEVTALDVERLMREEALRVNAIDAFARTALVRYLRQRIPAGWQRGEDWKFRHARAFGSWSAALGDRWREQKDAVWDAINGSMLVTPGWLPRDTTDPVIVAAFSKVSFD